MRQEAAKVISETRRVAHEGGRMPYRRGWLSTGRVGEDPPVHIWPSCVCETASEIATPMTATTDNDNNNYEPTTTYCRR